ncbi:hypothetical protein DOTSEDRAFT_33868 [Dothistroma septosporum NZE10]|uniref:Uncharacterized protein n=1 Tax=Dothistroma septosporum (strain NZE10 / CBS 128990) TaxID=675120 RepID=N1PPJ2_DOTSN|nr:hypothetical protein DOTSEDRAFT_33868 [Dothistroma septosporum NZE10]
MSLLDTQEHSHSQDIAVRSRSGTSTPSITTSRVPEHIMNSEIDHIYQTAGPATKILYELAFDPEHPREPNWIIRWMLWHVFRYRDGRQARGDALPRHDTGDNPSSDENDDSVQTTARPPLISTGAVSSNASREHARGIAQGTGAADGDAAISDKICALKERQNDEFRTDYNQGSCMFGKFQAKVVDRGSYHLAINGYNGSESAKLVDQTEYQTE